MQPTPVVEIHGVNCSILWSHLHAAVGTSAGAKKGKKEDEGSGNSDSVRISVYNAYPLIDTPGWSDAMCDDVHVGGISGTSLKKFLRRKFTGIVVMHVSDGYVRAQFAVLDGMVDGALKPGDPPLHFWVTHKTLLRAINPKKGGDVATFVVEADTCTVYLQAEIDDTIRTAGSYEIPRLAGDDSYQDMFSEILASKLSPDHRLVFPAHALAANLQQLLVERDDVVELSVRRSKTDRRAGLMLRCGDKTEGYRNRAFEIKRAPGDDNMVNMILCDALSALPPIIQKESSDKTDDSDRPHKKLRFTSGDALQQHMNRFQDEDEAEEVDEEEERAKERATRIEMARHSSEVERSVRSMAPVLSTQFRLDMLLKSIESICGDLRTVYLALVRNGSAVQFVMYAPTTRSRGLVVSTFSSRVEDDDN